MDKMNHKIVAGLAANCAGRFRLFDNARRSAVSRFHNTHAKYNGFFYAKEAMAEAEVILFEEYTGELG